MGRCSKQLSHPARVGSSFFIEAGNTLIKSSKDFKSDIQHSFSSFRIVYYRNQCVENEAKARLGNVKKRNLEIELIN